MNAVKIFVRFKTIRRSYAKDVKTEIFGVFEEGVAPPFFPHTMPHCAVANCSNTHRKTKGGSVRYHRFPGDETTRTRWVQACGGHVQNCATARVCSRHFSDPSYERDVQHEILGLPVRCRLKKGAVPDRNLPAQVAKDERPTDSTIAVLLAVGLVRAQHPLGNVSGGLPQE